MSAPPDAWQHVSKELAESKSDRVRELASQLSQIFGDESATQRALKLVADKQVDVAARATRLHSLLVQKNPRDPTCWQG